MRGRREDATLGPFGGKVNDLTGHGALAIITPTGPDAAATNLNEDEMPTRAVLFDFDGVIADTENVHVAAWQRTFGLMGWQETDEACERAAEADDRVFAAEVFARRKVDGDVEGWVARKQELTLRLLADSPKVYPGAVALVRKLEGQVRLGVVTTTWLANVESVLRASGIFEAFELIVAKEDVRAAKPDPEGYRLALARLGLPGEEVAALEDSPGGIEAARAAGLRVVAVGHRRAAGDWSDGAPFVASLGDLDAALQAIGPTTL